jgi:hypothetical protein
VSIYKRVHTYDVCVCVYDSVCNSVCVQIYDSVCDSVYDSRTHYLAGVLL